ncbi:MAG: hypothetical protein ABSH09_07265 [Bryobacteraceae bacterium]|jgi:hypothetical protein
MKHRLLILIAPLIAAAALAPAPVAAQNLNQMIQNQINMQRMGDQTAMAGARTYYNYALQLRRMGYTGPIPTGVTAESLNATNQQLQQQMQSNFQRTQQNMRATWDATTSTSNAITRGCSYQYWNGTRWICQ